MRAAVSLYDLLALPRLQVAPCFRTFQNQDQNDRREGLGKKKMPATSASWTALWIYGSLATRAGLLKQE